MKKMLLHVVFLSRRLGRATQIAVYSERRGPCGVSNSTFAPKSFSNFLHTAKINKKTSLRTPNQVFVLFPRGSRGPGNLLLELSGRPGSSRRRSGRSRRSSEEGRGENQKKIPGQSSILILSLLRKSKFEGPH